MVEPQWRTPPSCSNLGGRVGYRPRIEDWAPQFSETKTFWLGKVRQGVLRITFGESAWRGGIQNDNFAAERERYRREKERAGHW